MGRVRKESSTKKAGCTTSSVAAELREKVAEQALVREIGECGYWLEDRHGLAKSICRLVRSALGVEVCALFERSGGHWECLGGVTAPDHGPNPRDVRPGLLARAVKANGTPSRARARNAHQPPQMAISLRQGGDAGRWVMVLTASSGLDGIAGRQEFLAIIGNQVATLLTAAWMFERVMDTNRGLESELERHTEMLQDTRDQLHQQEKLASLGQLITGVAHELNNRFVPMLGYAQILCAQELPERAARAVQAIEKAARGSKQIVDDMLSFSRPATPHPEPCDLRQLLEEVVADFIIGGSALHPITLTGDERPCVAEVDPRQVEQVFHNLVQNALHAVADTDDGHVRVHVRSEGGNITVTVRDNGVGMTEEIRRRIFDPFFSTKGPGEGTGLGLSLSYGLVQTNRGTIRAESREGAGSTFTVSFPEKKPARTMKEASATPGKPKVSDNIFNPIDPEKRRVLVVDDEESVRELLVQALASEYDVRTAENGSAAREAIQEGHFDAVLLDLRMPRASGVELFKWVCDHQPDTAPHVVFMTGDQYDQTSSGFLETHPNPYLTKPFTLDELSRRLREAIG